MKMKNFAMGLITALAMALPTAAFAEGAVKIECWGRCDLVNLGQVCDTYSINSTPVAVACDDTAVGSGSALLCGSGTCRPFGTLLRSDLLSSYCDDGPANDAIVTCKVAGTLATHAEDQAAEKDETSYQKDRK